MQNKPKTIHQLDEELQNAKADFKEKIRGLKKTHIEQFNESWMDGQEVALALHISLRTLQTLRYSGQLPFSQLHKKIYYKVSDVKALLESNYSINVENKSHD